MHISKKVYFEPQFHENGQPTGEIKLMVQTKGTTYRNPVRELRKNPVNRNAYFATLRAMRKEASCLKKG